MGKAPKEIHDELKAKILESFQTEQGLKKGREVITRYRQRFPSAMNGMEETLGCFWPIFFFADHNRFLHNLSVCKMTAAYSTGKNERT